MSRAQPYTRESHCLILLKGPQAYLTWSTSSADHDHSFWLGGFNYPKAAASMQMRLEKETNVTDKNKTQHKQGTQARQKLLLKS